MATLIEDARFKLQSTIKDREKFAAEVFAKDGGPNEDDERKLDAMLNGEADLRVELARLEKFDKAASSGGQHPQTEEIRNPAKQPSRSAIQTLGARFVESAQFKTALDRNATGLRTPNGKFNTEDFGFKSLGEVLGGRGMNATLITGDSSTSAGAFVIADRFAELQTLGRRPLTILDLIRFLTTESDLVEYVAQTSRANNADTVPEATGTSDGTGAAPESAAAYVVRSTPVLDIAHFMPVTRRAVADVSQMRGLIDTELTDGVQETFENKVVNGAGGSDFTGILNWSGIQTQAWDTNILTTLRKAKTKISTVGRRFPNAYALNPYDWESIDLLQDNEARYFYGGPAAVGEPRVWGLPVAQAEAIAQGTALCADWIKATAWDREQAAISVSDSHADFFIRQLLAILCSMRAAFAVTQPTAFISIDLTA